LLPEIVGNQIGLPVLGAKQIAEPLGSGWCVTGSCQIAAEFAEQQAEVTVAPDEQSLECLDKSDHQAAIQLLIERAQQGREETEEPLANLGGQRMRLRRPYGRGIMRHTKPPGLEAAW
jgi:hypothetical protein